MQGDRKVLSLSYKSGTQTYNVLSVWESAKYPGSYSIARDKANGEYQAIGLFDALKGWGLGTGYLNVRTFGGEQRQAPAQQQTRARGGRQREIPQDEPPDDFADDDIPF